MLQLRLLYLLICWISMYIKDLISLTQCEQYAHLAVQNGKFIKVTSMCYATQALSANVVIDVYKAGEVLVSECTCQVAISLTSTNASSLIITPHFGMQPDYASCGSRIEATSDGGTLSQACFVFGEVPVQNNEIVTVKFLKERYPEDDRYCLLVSLRHSGTLSINCIDPLATTTVENRVTPDTLLNSTSITVSTPTNVSNDISTTMTSDASSSNQIATTSTIHSQTKTSGAASSASDALWPPTTSSMSYSSSSILSVISSTSSLDATTSASATTKEFPLTSTMSSSKNVITSHFLSVDNVTDHPTSEVNATLSESETSINANSTFTPTVDISLHDSETPTEKSSTTTFSVTDSNVITTSTEGNSEETDSTLEQSQTSITTEEMSFSTVQTSQSVSSTILSSPDTSSRLTRLQTTLIQSLSSGVTEPASNSVTLTAYDETTQFSSDPTTEDKSTQYSASELSDISTTAISVKPDVNITNKSSDKTPLFTTITSITEQTISLTTVTNINKISKKQSPEEQKYRLEAVIPAAIVSGLLITLVVVLIICARTDIFLPANSNLRKQDSLVERRSKYIVSKDTGVDNSAFNGVWLTDINVVIDEGKMTMMKENHSVENDDLFMDISKIEFSEDEDLTHF